MLITYRRTSGVCALLTFAAIAIATTVFTVAVVATVLIIALVSAVAGLVVRARGMLLTSWRYHPVRPAMLCPHETIEATVVNPTRSSNEADLLRMDSDKG